MLPVVIGTNPERTGWAKDCIASIRRTSRHRRVYVHTAGGYEPAAIHAGCERYKTFLFLHDSVTILDPGFWDVVDASGPAWLAGWPPMCMAIYEAAQVLPLLPTHQVTKREAVELEGTLPNSLPMETLWPDITDANHLRMETRHGRMNMVLGNHLWEKHKGNWGQGPL